MTYIPLVDFEDDYEILDEYPYSIRRIGSDRCISDRTRNSVGYITVYLNGRPYLHHRLIAKQFVENDDPLTKTEVDHINHDRTDNHVENLRWVTPSTNTRNRTGGCNGVQYTYIDYDEAPEDLIEVTDYGTHEFEDYCYSPSLNTFYFDNGIQYRELHINIEKRSGSAFVYAIDTDHKRVAIRYTKFKHLYDLQ